MKLSSFRLRLALLSATLAGTALIGFGFISWIQIYQTKLARLDSEIKNQLWQETDPNPKNWELEEEKLPAFLSGVSAKNIALMVLDNDGNILYRSPNLPSNFDFNNLFSQQIPSYYFASLISFQLQYSPPTNNPLLPPPRPRQRQRQFSEEKPTNSQPSQRLPPEQLEQLTKIITKKSSTGDWRIGLLKYPNIKIMIAVNLQEINQEMAGIRNIFLVFIPVILILIAVGAWWLSANALKSINQITKTIKNITIKGLDQRISLTGVDIEFIELLKVFNQMMERLERSFKQASRFSADAAHELKTPLAILQGVLERTIQQVETGSEIQANLINLLDEVRRLSSITRKLLLLSLADAGQMKIQKTTINFSELLTELAEDIEILAPALKVKLEIEPQLKVEADRDLLIQVLHNLISNAIKYNLPFGWINIHAQHQNNTIIMKISNSSKDIPISERKHLFDRFYRGDSAHNRSIEGLGLGLSLAREIIRAHGGDLKLDSPIPNQTTFILFLAFFD